MSKCKCGAEIVMGRNLDGEEIPIEVGNNNVYIGIQSAVPLGPGPFHIMSPPFISWISHDVICPARSRKVGTPVQESNYHKK